MPHVSKLFSSLIKSGRLATFDEMKFDSYGPIEDRRGMLVKPVTGDFLNQIKHPKMVLIEAIERNGQVTFRAPGMSNYVHKLNLGDEPAKRYKTNIYGTVCETVDQGDDVATWLSSFLDTPCRLTWMDKYFLRLVKEKYAPIPALTSLTDGFPITMVSQASLDFLNAKLAARGEQPVGAEEFRLQILIAGCRPHEEDGWKVIRIGSVTIELQKLKERCAIVQNDIRTGKITGKEPNRTLLDYSWGWADRNDERVRVPLFCITGVHRIQRPGDWISVGDKVDVLSHVLEDDYRSS